jgi:hypothetical protein
VTSTFFLQAFLPFLEVCVFWEGAPKFTPLVLRAVLELDGLLYGLVEALVDDETGAILDLLSNLLEMYEYSDTERVVNFYYYFQF